jgi:hypothetical protein
MTLSGRRGTAQTFPLDLLVLNVKPLIAPVLDRLSQLEVEILGFTSEKIMVPPTSWMAFFYALRRMKKIHLHRPKRGSMPMKHSQKA